MFLAENFCQTQLHVGFTQQHRTLCQFRSLLSEHCTKSGNFIILSIKLRAHINTKFIKFTHSMQSSGHTSPYVCRRCIHVPKFRNLASLRTHLQIVHDVTYLPPEDVALYRTFHANRTNDGSFVGTSFGVSPIPVTSTPKSRNPSPNNPNENTSNDALAEIRVCAQSIAQNNAIFQSELRSALVQTVNEAVSAVINNFLSQKSGTSRLLLSNLTQTNTTRTTVSVSTQTFEPAEPIISNVQRDNIPKTDSNNSQLEEKPATEKIQTETSSDEELLNVQLPEDENISIDQIRIELEMPVSIHSF